MNQPPYTFLDRWEAWANKPQDSEMREPRPTQPEPAFSGRKLVPVKPAIIRYSGLYEYAQANKLNYNELCTVVRTACGIKE